MTTETTTNAGRLTRRTALCAGLGALAGLFMTQRARASTPLVMQPDDYCYWKLVQGPSCTNHQLHEYQCEVCCGGGTCETVSCGWYITGTC
jgi:hypothetical protein